MMTLNLYNMEKSKKDKIVFWLKVVAAVVAALLSVLGVTSVASCSTSTQFTMSADTLYMDNPNIQFKDSTNVSFPDF